MEDKEREATSVYFKNILEQIHKPTQKWDREDFKKFLEIIEFKPSFLCFLFYLITNGIKVAETVKSFKRFNSLNENNLDKYKITKIQFKKVKYWQTLLCEYNLFFNEQNPNESDDSQKVSNKLKKAKSENFEIMDSYIVIEYLFDNSKYPITKDGGKFGRSPENDIVLSDKDVSRKHAEIFFLDDKFYLKDLNSSIGTFIKLEKSRKLEKNMRFQLGELYLLTIEDIFDLRMKFRVENEDDEEENEKTQEIDFNLIGKKKPILIGTASNCNIKLFGKDKIGDRHCSIYKNETNEIVLEDLNSKQGTWLMLEKYPVELKKKMDFKLGGNNIFNVSQIIIKQKSNVHILQEKQSEEGEGLKETEDLCIICCENPKTGVILPCKHNFMCVRCTQGLRICPICRNPIQKIIEIKP